MATEAWPLSGPSNNLITLLRACPSDPTEEMKARLSHMLHEFVQHHRNDKMRWTKESVEKCCCEAEEWYYNILELLLSQGSRSQGGVDISETLWKDNFQRYLVVLCLEFAISSNQLPCDITKLLQIFKLAAYIVPLVIELMLWFGLDLSHDVIRHLIPVEYNILESLAWTGDSPLWKKIEGGLPSSQQVIPPNPNSWFACKVYKLMAKRLSELCSKLEISDALKLKIWACLEHSLVRYTSLMVDHHLDEMLLLAVHCMAKITNTNLTFINIVNCYESQSFANKKVCEDMLLLKSVVENHPTEANDSGDHRAAILTPCTPSEQEKEEEKDEVSFYQDYSKKMQDFAKQFAPNFGGETPPQSPYPKELLAKKPAFSHPHLLNSHIFISPLRETISPIRSGLCYNFGSSPSKCLRQMNNMMKTGTSCTRARCALSFDPKNKAEEGEDGPSSKRVRSDDQSVLKNLLMNVVNDRAKVGNQDQA
ncbi:retinoblastoma-like protein 2 [Leuresthes tenuis]|uniref:retinoblastoma-like protein 2 n=1 Tax=Leuresthes tenuis TaxID=355514 RepID=UPI003B50C537